MLSLLVIAVFGTTYAQEAKEKENVTLIKNANIFDGKSDKLVEGMSVLVEGNKIAKIAKSITAPSGATVIDAKGRTMTPGLIFDAHVHLFWNTSPAGMFSSPQDYLYALSLKEAEATLMRGYTGVRDISGSVQGIKRAIDEGIYPGPRIWSAGADLSMTAGHADLKTDYTVPRALGGPYWTDVEYIGMSIVVDGVPEILSAARLQHHLLLPDIFRTEPGPVPHPNLIDRPLWIGVEYPEAFWFLRLAP